MDHNKFTGTYMLLATRHRASNIAAVPYHISYTLTHIRGPADLGVWTLTHHAKDLLPFRIASVLPTKDVLPS